VNPSYLILAGTEKSGTTSVYQYLAAHPGVAASARKETDYFRSPSPHALPDYEVLFPGAAPGLTRMEASPGYLAESHLAAPAIAALVPDAKLLFILRDPIDRLLSSFEFHKSRFFIPQAMSFDAYVDLCMRAERREIGPKEAGLGDWFLRVPDAGRYEKHLRDYEACFARGQVKVMTLDALQRDARSFMRTVCEWAGLDDAFYDGFDFVRANVTFSPRRAWLQRVGLWVNDAMEPFFNRHPAVKQRLLAWYKRINGRQVEKPRMSHATARVLLDYYRDDVEALFARFGDDVAEARGWLTKHRPAAEPAQPREAGQAA
jgi:hypothetical protein